VAPKSYLSRLTISDFLHFGIVHPPVSEQSLANLVEITVGLAMSVGRTCVQQDAILFGQVIVDKVVKRRVLVRFDERFIDGFYHGLSPLRLPSRSVFLLLIGNAPALFVGLALFFRYLIVKRAVTSLKNRR